MPEYKIPNSEAEFEKNFSQKKPLMNSTEAYYESSRCLFCYDAPCMKACPTHIDIPLFIKQIQTGNSEGSAKTIFDANWFGNACGKVCPTAVLCEGACVFNHQHVKPIDIGRLQYFATQSVISKNKNLYQAGKSNGKKVAVIGGGPAGIACACELRIFGFQVDIFEAKAKPSGLAIYGVAPYKITNEEVTDEVEWLRLQLGFEFIYNSPITTSEQLAKIENKYDAIFLGVGIGPTSTLGIPGEDLQNVVGAVELIEQIRMKHHEEKIPRSVIVIGGGNTAMDAASESARMGAEKVVLAYRRGKNEMGAYSFEYQTAISSGVEGMFNIQPVEIIGTTNVSGVKFIRTKVVNDKLELIPGSEFTLDCEMVIKATGQAKQGNLFSLIAGLKVDAQKKVIVNDAFQTTNSKYFAGGDAVNGGAEVVNAAYEGKMAAKGIHSWLENK